MIDTELDFYYLQQKPTIKLVKFKSDIKDEKCYRFEIKENDKVIYSKYTTYSNFKNEFPKNIKE